MVDRSDVSRQPAPSPSDPLIDRVRGRLAYAGVRFDRRARATRPRKRGAAAPFQPSEAQSDYTSRRERACLRDVFHELGDAHRGYRSRTGNAVTPSLRAATTAFKQEPSLVSLLPVAAFLDELGLLDW